VLKLGQPDWAILRQPGSHRGGSRRELLIHLILNAYWDSLEFELPRAGNDDGDSWHRWIDTTLDSPQDIVEWETANGSGAPIGRASLLCASLPARR